MNSPTHPGNAARTQTSPRAASRLSYSRTGRTRSFLPPVPQGFKSGRSDRFSRLVLGVRVLGPVFGQKGVCNRCGSIHALWLGRSSDKLETHEPSTLRLHPLLCMYYREWRNSSLSAVANHNGGQRGTGLRLVCRDCSGFYPDRMERDPVGAPTPWQGLGRTFSRCAGQRGSCSALKTSWMEMNVVFPLAGVDHITLSSIAPFLREIEYKTEKATSQKPQESKPTRHSHGGHPPCRCRAVAYSAPAAVVLWRRARPPGPASEVPGALWSGPIWGGRGQPVREMRARVLLDPYL